MLDSIALMNGLTHKMDYLQTRQRVVAQNISNADTPGYQAMDVKSPDFKKEMSRYFNPNQLAGAKLGLETTAEGHMNQRMSAGRPTEGDKNRQPYEIAPAKNAVSLEEQMMNASQTAIDYQLVTNLYNKQVGMLRTAMGR